MTTAQGFRGAGTVTLSDVYVVQNKAGTQGGGIFNGTTLVTSPALVTDNQPDNCVESGAGSGCP
jgi:predicted outer membrane repeat protein